MPTEVNQATQYCKFPTPQGTQWSDINITFLTRDIVSIKCGTMIAQSYDRLHIPCMFSDKTTEKLPTKRWYLLMAFAVWGPVLTRNHLRSVLGHNDWETMRAQKLALSKSLKNFFSQQHEPIIFNKATNEYQCLLGVRQHSTCRLSDWLYDLHEK